ncbi:MAG TPA: hypothetical protein PLW16_07405 [Syntrophales bacterium]|nr:hypothetical protein [Syntrophales bacterium]
MKKKLNLAFITGLAVIISIGITLYVLAFLIGAMDRFLDWISTPYHPDTLIGFHITEPGLIVIVTFILLSVAATRSYLGKHIVRYVFVPTTPSPTLGYYLMVPTTEVIDVTMTLEEAFTKIIFCGIATPPGNSLFA